MRVTVIPSDNTIGVNGRFLAFGFAADPNVHAIQWYENYGEMEFVDGRQNRPLYLGTVEAVVSDHERLCEQNFCGGLAL